MIGWSPETRPFGLWLPMHPRSSDARPQPTSTPSSISCRAVLLAPSSATPFPIYGIWPPDLLHPLNAEPLRAEIRGFSGASSKPIRSTRSMAAAVEPGLVGLPIQPSLTFFPKQPSQPAGPTGIAHLEHSSAVVVQGACRVVEAGGLPDRVVANRGSCELPGIGVKA